MSADNFEIKRWDGVITSQDTPLPAIYFLPSKALLEQMMQNKNNRIQIEIQGTNSMYDNIWIGMIDQSANIPNCRKNFYDASNYWVITLMINQDNLPASWQGPPTNYGSFKIVDGVYQSYKNTTNFNKPLDQQSSPLIKKYDNTSQKRMRTESSPEVKETFLQRNKVIIILIIIFLILSVVMGLYVSMQKKGTKMSMRF